MPRTTRKNERQPRRAVRREPTLTRTKSLLLAALRVWELKHRISPEETRHDRP
jgi:hypothetical protein